MANSGNTDSADPAMSTIVPQTSALTIASGSSSTSSSAQTGSAIPPSLSSNTQLSAPPAKAPESTTEYIFTLFSAGRITPQEYKTILLGSAFEYSTPSVKNTIDRETNPVRDFTTDLRSSDRITQEEYELFSAIYNAEHFDPRVKLANATIQLRYPAKNVKKAVEVFNIAELLHSILEYADYSHGLTHAKLTCRRFNFTVEDSPTLRDRTAFVIRITSPLPQSGLLNDYVGKRMRERVLNIYKSLGQPNLDDDHMMAVHCFLGSKFNFRIEGLHWGPQNSEARPADNTFHFDFESCRQTFAGYSTSPALRSFRVWDDPVQKATLIFRGRFSEGGNLIRRTSRAPTGQDLTFGHIFDEMAKHVPKGSLVDKFTFEL